MMTDLISTNKYYNKFTIQIVLIEYIHLGEKACGYLELDGKWEENNLILW